MSEQNKSDEKSPQLATSGITIAAFLLGLFFLQDTIFNPTRPGMIDTEKGMTENIRSRLWQDPFEVVNEHISKNHSNKNHYPNIAEKLIITDNYQKITGLLSSEHHAKKDSQKFARHPFPANPEHAIENGAQPMRICYQENLYENNEEPAAHSVTELRCQIQQNTTPDDVLVLAVMVPGGPYAEDRETRLRSRYALIMSLLSKQYVPEDAEHIGFVHFSDTCKQNIKAHNFSVKESMDICQMPATMPYEWFKAKDSNQFDNKNNNRILVLWLDNDAFYRSDNPLYMLGLLSYLTSFDEAENEARKNANFHVIGPANSDTLEKMYQEVSKLKENIREKNYYKYLQNSYIYTASATISKTHLENNKSWGGSIRKENLSWLNDTFVRTISTQDQIANTILCELALRGITPYHVKTNETIIKKFCGDIDDLVLNKTEEPHRIALITEADTFYATMMTQSIHEKIKEFDDPSNSNTEKQEILYTFRYLRGLDGITSQSISSEQNKSNDKESKAKNPSDKETKVLLERPVGNSQLDYLLGLGENLKQIENVNIKAGKGTFKAIGIIGSDTYDKLLILQALRSKFPGVPFFTTDLDARFMHPTETKWTRNLIVISPFDLQINPEIFKNNITNISPPFRDNFQASIYTSALLAMHCNKGFSDCKNTTKSLAENWTKSPRVFEIGNHGAVNLNHKKNLILDFEPPQKTDGRLVQDTIIYSLTLLCIFLLAAISTFFTPRHFHSYIRLAIKAVLILQIPILLYQYHEYLPVPDTLKSNLFSYLDLIFFTEPLSFTNGISSWPANAIRLGAIILAYCFLIRTYKLLVANQKEMQNEFIMQNYVSSKENRAESNVEKTSNLLSIDNNRKNSAETKLKQQEKRKLRYSRLRSKLSIDKWRLDSTNFQENWLIYLKKRKLHFSVIRVTGMFVMFVMLTYMVLYIVSDSTNFIPYAPFRGELNFKLSHIIFELTVVIYLALVLYIADNAHLSSHFIRGLADNRSLLWPSELVKIYKKKYDLPVNIIESKIFLDFITRHTEVHNKFIYYPFFCLFLIIMSRNNYFDNWPTTPFIVLTYVFFALITLISAIRLRAAALYAKGKILENLKTNSTQSPIHEWRGRQNDNIIKLKSLTTEIENFKEGIFRPLLHHPMILSLLMPFSSVSGIFLIEYLV